LTLVAAGRLKSIGHINTLDTVPGIELSAVYPAAIKTKLVLGISVSAKNHAADIKEFEARIKRAQSIDGVQEVIRLNGYKPSYMTAKDAEVVLQDFRLQYMKQ
jgi:hypothetical protein